MLPYFCFIAISMMVYMYYKHRVNNELETNDLKDKVVEVDLKVDNNYINIEDYNYIGKVKTFTLKSEAQDTNHVRNFVVNNLDKYEWKKK